MRSLVVLVVDDEQGIRDLLRDALVAAGHGVISASNGVEAVEIVTNAPPDVIFLDIRMPKGDGLTALRQIRAIKPHLPVVLITGCSGPEVAKEAFDLDVSASLIKPFSVRDVMAMIEVVQVQMDWESLPPKMTGTDG